MPDSLPALEAERSHILRQIASLADLRSGSICAVARRCGKPTSRAGGGVVERSTADCGYGAGYGSATTLSGSC
jgi:hypothetical protein